MSISRRYARFRHRRLLRRMAGPRLLRAFADSYPKARFVEIGANDGDQHDHLKGFIAAGGWGGVMVEPVPYVFERLRRNFGHLEGVELEMAAIGSHDGTVRLFHLRHVDDPVSEGLPSWYDGIGSLSRGAVLAHAPQIPDIADRMVESEVASLTFDSLCARHGLEQLDVLAIDTEGHDWEILKVVDLSVWRPRLLVFEHYHLSGPDRAAAAAHVNAHGYEILAEGFDSFCLRTDEDDDLTRRFRALKPAIPAAAKELERA